VTDIRWAGLTTVLLSTLALAACGDLTRSLGGLEGGEEFQAVKAPPLALPPDYNLRPPVPGGRGAPAQRSSDYARQSVFGVNQPDGSAQPGASGRSAGESALLTKAQERARVTPDIRSTVDEETEELKQTEAGFVDKVLEWDEEAPEGQADGEDQDLLKTVVTGDDKPVIKRGGGIFE